MYNIHLVMNSFRPDKRVLKEALALADAGIFNKIIIIALKSQGFPESETVNNTVTVWRVPLRTKILPSKLFFQTIKYFEWQVKIKKFIKNKKIEVVHCHDLGTLPVGIKIKRQTRCKVIYDAHELETEKNNLAGIKKLYRKKVEKRLIKKIDHFISVSPSIIEWYQDKYGVTDVTLLRNIPDKRIKQETGINLRDKCDLDKNSILFVYCGYFFKNRGIEVLVNLFSELDKNIHILFLGKGELAGFIEESAKIFLNIHYYGFIPYEKLISSMASCDVGIMVKDNRQSLSQYFSLPNKFFLYLDAGLPVMVSQSLDVEQLIERLDIGWKAAIDNVKDKIKALKKNEISLKKQNVRYASKSLDWNIEKGSLIDAYKDLTGGDKIV